MEHLECQQTCCIMAPKTGSKKVVKTWQPYRDRDCSRKPVGLSGTKACVNIHAHASASQICMQNIGGQEPHCPMADRIFGSKSDPIFGSKSGPQNGVQNWITFSYLLVGLCLDPVLGSGVGPKNGVRFGPKNAVSNRRILPRPGKGFSADLRCIPQEHDS